MRFHIFSGTELFGEFTLADLDMGGVHGIFGMTLELIPQTGPTDGIIEKSRQIISWKNRAAVVKSDVTCPKPSGKQWQ